MNNAASIIRSVRRTAAVQSPQTIVGKNLYLQDLFLFFYQRDEMKSDLALLTTASGLILCFLAGDNELDDLPGTIIEPGELFDPDDPGLCRYEIAGRYTLFLLNPEPRASADSLNADLQAQYRLHLLREADRETLENSLDFIDNSISIYDTEARLIYANHSFCRDFRIRDRDAAYGLTIQTIMKNNGISVYAIDDNSPRLKMMEVLQTGRAALNWEVRIEIDDAPKKSHFVSNDMYPTFSENGTLTGMIEITHSRQQDLSRTRKIIGLSAASTFDDIIGESPAIREQIRIAKSYADNPYNILITGESGVGKDLMAQAIHNYSARRSGPFVAVNCASFPENLIESELFGYVSGAFTGASKKGHIGKFELADKGTLFLDEIGELPLHFQPKLLRVLESWIVTRIGSSQAIPVNVRLIAATNRDLEQMVRDGLFREDLYYRLQVLSILIPPLRERREDVLLLAEKFLEDGAELYHADVKTLDPGAKQALMEYNWPGNIRELRNIISRVIVLNKTGTITREEIETAISPGRRPVGSYSSYDLSAARQGAPIGAGSLYGAAPGASAGITSGPAAGTSPASSDAGKTPEERLASCRKKIDDAYAEQLATALDITEGNKSKAAELLGISRQTFYRMIEKYLPE